MSFGERLKAARKIREFTHAQLTELLGYGGTTIFEYEKGNNKASLDVFIQICKLLNQDANYFLQDDIQRKESQLNPKDKKRIDKYKALTPHDKEIVDYILNMEKGIQLPEPTISYRFQYMNSRPLRGPVNMAEKANTI